MSEVIQLPEIGEDVQEVTLAVWLKQPGERIEQGEIIAEAQTDKANIEIETPYTGVLEATLVEEGATVSVGQPIARVTTSD